LAALEPALIVVEATGGYERPVVAQLHAHGLAVAVVNPRRVRAFARAQGHQAKTDRLDAQLLARFGQALQPRPQPAPQPAIQRLQALVRRREQVLAMRSSERQRRHLLATSQPEIVGYIDQVLAVLEQQCQDLDAQIAALVAAEAPLAARAAHLESVPGVGPVVAATVLAELPELGQVTGKEVAALAGLAPFSRQSGAWQGRGRIGGGRAGVRRVLYLAVVSARVHNPRIRAFYERLRAAGKPAKVVMVACARKLLTLLNAMLATQTPWCHDVPGP
jgi:transposase